MGRSDDSDINQKLLVVADPGMEEEVLTRLSRVGYDQTIGYLGGFDAWKNAGKEVDTLEQIIEGLKDVQSQLW